MDVIFVQSTNQRRRRAKLRKMLQMRKCEKFNDTCYQGLFVRDALAEKLCLDSLEYRHVKLLTMHLNLELFARLKICRPFVH